MSLIKQLTYLAKNFKKFPIIATIEGSTTEWNGRKVIWLAHWEEPDLSYEFNETRIGIGENMKLIYGNSSGCSCPSPWSNGDDYYNEVELDRILETQKEYGYHPDNWKEELTKTIDMLYNALKDPSKLKGMDVLGMENAELRRVLIELMGMEKFIQDVNPQVLDDDPAVGQLLKIDLKQTDEDIVLLRVKDASTPREYFLRVPPKMRTALEAKAWTFGFKAEDFKPLIET